MYGLLFSGSKAFNPFCNGFTFQSDPCHGNGVCYGAGQCHCSRGFGPEVSYSGQPLCGSPWPCGDLCGAPEFPDSRLITPEWGSALRGWSGASHWRLCYSTFDDPSPTAAAFHQACDAHETTLTVAHNAGNGGSNPGNFTFGGFVRSPPKPAEACITTVF